VPVPTGANAKYLREILRWSLLVVVLSAPLVLWWPSIEGWTALGMATLAIWLLWLSRRTLTGATDVPSHPLYLALLGVWALACYNAARWGWTSVSAESRPMLGQLAASLATHISLVALLAMLIQDLLAHRPLSKAIVTLFGISVLCGAVGALIVTQRDEGRLMLALMGWTGLSVLCWPLWQRSGKDAAGRRALWRRIERYGRMAIATVAAVVLSVLCPTGVLVTTGAAAVALLIAAICLRGKAAPLALAALVALISCGAHAWNVGWIRLPAWPRTTADWLGRGGDALVEFGPWTNDLALLAGTVGWAPTLWLLAGLLAGLIWALWPARHGGRDEQSRAVLASLTIVLATAAWLSPGGLFNPAVNVTFVAVWAVCPAALGRNTKRRSGWWVFAVVVCLSLALALVRKVGLLIWAVTLHGRDDDVLHVFIGWLTTHVLLWLFTSRKRGPYIAIGISLAGAAAGEIAQICLSSRSAQMKDLLGHAIGAAFATAIYVVCRACLWSESPDMPSVRSAIADDAPPIDP